VTPPRSPSARSKRRRAISADLAQASITRRHTEHEHRTTAADPAFRGISSPSRTIWPSPDTVWRLAARLRLCSRETKGGLCGQAAKASRAGYRRSAGAREVGSGGLGRGRRGDGRSRDTANSQEPTRHRPFSTEGRAQVGTVLEPRPIPCPPVAAHGREAHRSCHEQSQAGVTSTRLVGLGTSVGGPIAGRAQNVWSRRRPASPRAVRRAGRRWRNPQIASSGSGDTRSPSDVRPSSPDTRQCHAASANRAGAPAVVAAARSLLRVHGPVSAPHGRDDEPCNTRLT
jgi:hypothetical protein